MLPLTWSVRLPRSRFYDTTAVQFRRGNSPIRLDVALPLRFPRAAPLRLIESFTSCFDSTSHWSFLMPTRSTQTTSMLNGSTQRIQSHGRTWSETRVLLRDPKMFLGHRFGLLFLIDCAKPNRSCSDDDHANRLAHWPRSWDAGYSNVIWLLKKKTIQRYMDF